MSSGFRNRMLGNPQFVMVLLIEQAIGISAKLAAEIEARKGRFWKVQSSAQRWSESVMTCFCGARCAQILGHSATLWRVLLQLSPNLWQTLHSSLDPDLAQESKGHHADAKLEPILWAEDFGSCAQQIGCHHATQQDFLIRTDAMHSRETCLACKRSLPWHVKPCATSQRDWAACI